MHRASSGDRELPDRLDLPARRGVVFRFELQQQRLIFKAHVDKLPKVRDRIGHEFTEGRDHERWMAISIRFGNLPAIEISEPLVINRLDLMTLTATIN